MVSSQFDPKPSFQVVNNTTIISLFEPEEGLTFAVESIRYLPAKTRPGDSFNTGRMLIAAAVRLTISTPKIPINGVNHIMRNGKPILITTSPTIAHTPRPMPVPMSEQIPA